ncbi:MAG TPA: Glu-tRNA(Gln) amidotransferase subunit GatE [Conexivisphaerales archaeon]|nr:Glu-tRNA(Gln) amidotransferase subunit GatE [Conexivisphaerales archaeon]
MTSDQTLPELDPKRAGLKVGLEIHRQLNTRNKLFCGCGQQKEDGEKAFRRRLRPSQSEMGKVDPAALFEASKNLWLNYYSGESSSCLVEADEEPPHDLNPEALESALMISSLFSSDIVDEVHVMRKMVIDGSNTTGFQRTMVVALGGTLRTSLQDVPILSVTLEEDAARNLGEGEGERDFALDRLGIPLIELSLAPVTATPAEVQEIAGEVGRILKATGRVDRGLGTIRQDINVSVKGGEVIEVKGVQQLDLVAKVVEYEARRQLWLLELASILKKEGADASKVAFVPQDCSGIFIGTQSKLVGTGMKKGRVFGLRAPGFAGHLSQEPFPDTRLGRELADLARFFKLGGLLHSDELPGYGVTPEEVEAVRKQLGCGDRDGFILLIGEESRALLCLQSLTERLRQAFVGPPAETRGPMNDGGTRYIRPRPGSARMYPETDTPPIPVTAERVSSASGKLPPPWEEQVRALTKKHGLGKEQAQKVLDSEYYDLFEKVVGDRRLAPTFVASFLTETMVSLSREGLDTGSLDRAALEELLGMMGRGELAKEAGPAVLRAVLSKKAAGVPEAVESLKFAAMSASELSALVAETVREGTDVVRLKGMDSFSFLMGRVMSKARGRVDGAKVSEELKRQLEGAVAKTKK